LYKLQVNRYNIDRSEFLNSLNFNVPQCQTRSTDTFYVQIPKTNYAFNASVNITMCLVNDNQIESFCNYILLVVNYLQS